MSPYSDPAPGTAAPAAAGRLLDAAIAHEVFGYQAAQVQMYSLGDDDSGEATLTPDGIEWRYCPVGEQFLKPLPRYSTDIRDAWLVVEHLLKQKMYPDVITGANKDGTVAYSCYIDKFIDPESDDDSWPVSGFAETAPLAVCRAALKAHDALTAAAVRPPIADEER